MTLKERELPPVNPVVAERVPAPAVSALVAERPEASAPAAPPQPPAAGVDVPPTPRPSGANPAPVPPVVKGREPAGFELPASKLFAEMPGDRPQVDRPSGPNPTAMPAVTVAQRPPSEPVTATKTEPPAPHGPVTPSPAGTPVVRERQQQAGAVSAAGGPAGREVPAPSVSEREASGPMSAAAAPVVRDRSGGDGDDVARGPMEGYSLVAPPAEPLRSGMHEYPSPFKIMPPRYSAGTRTETYQPYSHFRG